MVDRLGAEFDNVQLEKRVREIEREVSDLSITARAGDVDLDDGIPTVSGLSLVPGDGRGIAIRWNDAGIPQTDLDFYEVQFATNTGFSANVFNYNTKDLQFQFSEGDTETTYFARVRVALNSGLTGSYSAILNTTTGQAETDDIEDDAVTEPSNVLTTGSITVNDLTSNTIQTLVVDKDGSDLYIMASVVHETNGIAASAANIVNVSIRKDGVELMEMRPLSWGQRTSSLTMIVPDTSGSTGSTTYTIFADNTSVLGIDVTFTNRTLVAVELKR